MAEPILSFVLETLGKLLIKEAKFLSEVSGEAMRLHSELKMMRAFLEDADGKQHDAIVREWVSQCRDLAYEAENVLEDYAFKLESRMRGKGRLSMVKRFSCILSECRIRHNVGLGIRSLSTRVSDLTQRFEKYGIRASLTEGEGSTASQQQLMRMTYPYVANDEDFVGLQGDVDELVQVLVKKDSYNSVVSITGMGGSGKTTLARKIYNHPNVKKHFDNFAWVCVSQQLQTRNLLLGILVSFLLMDKSSNIHDKLTDNQIVEQLVQIQQEKKCFVVLDDIWSTYAWECIKDAFPLKKEGSKILITTRNINVAEFIGPNGYHHQQRLLTNIESWELLMKKAMRDKPNQGYKDIQNLEDLGKEMVKTCGGLPLAVVVLGGILATKQSFPEWNSVYENMRFYLGKGERIEQDEGEVQRILALSYSDLPFKLKPCFLYLSVFKEDEDIKVDRLYNLWIAEGMVFSKDLIRPDESMEEIADRYLGELARRCIVMVKEKEQPSHGRYSSCHLHDLMRDLCKAKAREENFLDFLNYGQENDIELASSISSSTSTISRIMISVISEDARKSAPGQLEDCKNLRTLLFCVTGGYGSQDDFTQLFTQLQINRFKMLRSLIFEGMHCENSRMPSPIGKLIHLRYLRLSSCKFALSPTSISNLEHLETLDLGRSCIIWTESVPIKARHLRYLHLPFSCIPPMQIYVPTDIEVLIIGFLEHFEVKNLSELTNVRELGNIFVSPDAIEKDVEDLFRCIVKSHHMKQVTILRCGYELFKKGESALLRELFSSNVQYLCLDAPLEKLPEYDHSHFLTNLVTLKLENSHIEEDPMKILERLPKLQKLELLNLAFSGREMVCHSTGFVQLTFLGFNELYNFQTWIVEKGAMPNLSHFEIKQCKRLQMIPRELRLIEPLKEIVFDNMPGEFLKQSMDDFHNVPSIVIKNTKLELFR